MAFWRSFLARPAAVPAPAADPLTHEKIALGRRLFEDTRLSGPGTVSCKTCHRREHGWTGGLARAAALDGGLLARNTPTLWNLAWASAFFWDGRAASLEDQARGPIEHPREMGGNWPVITARLRGDPSLAAAFSRAFPESPAVSRDTILRALAAFERTLVSPSTPFDRWIAGDSTALSPAAEAGFRLFTGRAGCAGCHAGWRFTDDGFHDIGLADGDPGRGAVAGGVPGLGAFKTPTLRELRWTAPYMHDGSKAALSSVLDHYTDGIAARPGADAHLVRPLVLDATERADLTAFLLSLSSEPEARGAADRDSPGRPDGAGR